MADFFKNLRNSWQGLQDASDEARDNTNDISANLLVKHAGLDKEEALRRIASNNQLAEAAGVGSVSPLGAEGSFLRSPAVSEEFTEVLANAVKKRGARGGTQISTGASPSVVELDLLRAAPLKEAIKNVKGGLSASEEAILSDTPRAILKKAPDLKAIEAARSAKAASVIKEPLQQSLQMPSVADEYAQELSAAPEKLARLRALLGR